MALIFWLKNYFETIYWKWIGYYFVEELLIPKNSNDSPIIILIHGRNSGSYSLRKLGNFLSSKGIIVRYFNYPNGETAVKSELRFKNFLKEQNLQNQKNIIIGHSKGGVLAKLFANEMSELVITLSTPHRGSILANIPAIKFRRDISEFSFPQERVQISNPICNIYSKWDEMIIPSSSLKLVGAYKNIEINDYGHGATIFSEVAFDIIVDELLPFL